jgi:RNA polymerase sigma factor (sigma-70 family)
VSNVSSQPRPLEEVYRSSQAALTRLAFLLVGDRDDADDIVQSVFATAADRWSSIDDPPTYLRRAVANRAHDVHRRSFRPAAPVAGDANADEPQVDVVWSFVNSLPTAQRAVIVLRFYEDLSLVDIAVVLGRPENTVRSDLRRALSHLKRILP